MYTVTVSLDGTKYLPQYFTLVVSPDIQLLAPVQSVINTFIVPYYEYCLPIDLDMTYLSMGSAPPNHFSWLGVRLALAVAASGYGVAA